MVHYSPIVNKLDRKTTVLQLRSYPRIPKLHEWEWRSRILKEYTVTFEIIHDYTNHHILEEFSLQQHCCKNKTNNLLRQKHNNIV